MDHAYLRFAACCAAALALTTFLIWLLPQLLPEANAFEDRLALAKDPTNLARLWITMLHMLLGFAAMLGAYLLLRVHSQGFAAFGLAMFFTWMLVELLAASAGLFTVNLAWRASFAQADAEQQAVLRTLLAGWPGVFDALYFVLAVAYLIGTTIFGALALRGERRAAIAGVFMLLGAAASLAFLVTGYGGPAWPGMLAGQVYPVMMPTGRLAIAWWLWKSTEA